MVTTWAYAYSRFSRAEQGKGDSARRQEEKIAAFCAAHHLTLDTTLDLRDFGVSAFRGRHRTCGALSHFLEGVQSGKVRRGSWLLVEDIDRLSREPVMDAFELFSGLLKSGITIALLDKDWIITKESFGRDQGQVFMTVGSMIRAHEESVRKSELIRAARERERRDEAKGLRKAKRRCPSWLEWDDAAKDYVVRPVEAAAVQRMFDLASEGMSFYRIAKQLIREGFQPFGGGDHWQTVTLTKIFNSETVLGTYQPHELRDGKRIPIGDPIPDYYPQIVSKEVFALAQANRNAAGTPGPGRRGKTWTNVFNGLLRCSCCGSGMFLKNFSRPDRPTKVLRYLICARKWEDKTACQNRNFRYDKVERVILSHVRELDLGDLLGDTRGPVLLQEAKIVEAEHRLQSVTKRIDTLVDKMEEADETTAPILMQRLKERTAERAGIEAELDGLRRELDRLKMEDKRRSHGPRSVEALYAKMAQATEDELYLLRQKMCRSLCSFIDEIRCDPSGAIYVSVYDRRRIYVFDQEGFITAREPYVSADPDMPDTLLFVEPPDHPVLDARPLNVG